jgi:hypothetical protein
MAFTAFRRTRRIESPWGGPTLGLRETWCWRGDTSFRSSRVAERGLCRIRRTCYLFPVDISRGLSYRPLVRGLPCILAPACRQHVGQPDVASAVWRSIVYKAFRTMIGTSILRDRKNGTWEGFEDVSDQRLSQMIHSPHPRPCDHRHRIGDNLCVEAGNDLAGCAPRG